MMSGWLIRLKAIFGLMVMGASFSICINGQNKKPLSAEEVLQKAATKLAALKTIKFNYRQEYNYASERYFAESKAESYLEFTPIESVIGLRFQFANQDMFHSYNGSEIFLLNKKDKTIRVEMQPKIERLGSVSILQYSPLMLRNALPKVIADKTIAKSVSETKINNVSYYVVEFALDKAFLDSAVGDVKPMTIERKTVYRLTIDKRNFMPIEIYRGNNVNKDFNKTTYSEIAENPQPPTETSWYYTTYLGEYKYAEPAKNNLIKAGETAHDLNLPLFPNNQTVSLSQYKGSLVLLDFWIFHCAPCQEGVPKLNALQAKYQNKNFKLLTVNVTDSNKLIQLVVKKTKAKFPILYKGGTVGQKYGVPGYPTVVLIGKDGRVIYASLFDQRLIEGLIEKNL